MNNFNNVFLAIKSLSDDDGVIKGGSVLKQIARGANIPLAGLGFYLQVLNDLQIINYSAADDCIYLTSQGIKKDKLFMV